MSIILVTGASAGIGKATAHALLDQGHTVYVAARRLEAMEELAARGAVALRMDVTNDAEVDAAVARILTEHGRIDVVIVEPGLIATEFGDVMTAPMLERSGNGPYGDLARAIA